VTVTCLVISVHRHQVLLIISILRIRTAATISALVLTYAYINMRVYTLAARLFSSACCSLCNIHAPFSEDVSLHYGRQQQQHCSMNTKATPLTMYEPTSSCSIHSVRRHVYSNHVMLLSLFAEKLTLSRMNTQYQVAGTKRTIV
jgi:hypothetical protein